MKLYRIWQTVNNDYDTYDSAIVCAENEEEARNTLPSPYGDWGGSMPEWADSPKQVKVKEIGIANSDQKKGVVLASFNAG